MKIAFTICSNNYLAQAKILEYSLLEKNSDYKFIIGLCDEFSEDIDYSFLENIEIIPASQFGIYCFDEIIKKYDIVELNTSIKASFFKYLISKYENLETIIYFDPDIQIFNKLSLLEKYLKEYDILLTPHILNPIGVDDFSPAESSFLNYGIYNLGFLALNPKSQNARDLLDWWEDKTLKIGFSQVSNGLFVDQLWINLVP
ncbi:MAG: glycosyltransferase, partial [Flavobacterium nitrogenifigens]